MTKKSPKEFLEEIEYVLKGYSNELRATVQPYILARVSKNVSGHKYQPEDELVLESLIEHVGSTPIVATAFYPYIDDAEVDLGRALTMLAINDIGELKTGDENTFTKNRNNKAVERKAALSLLHSSYHYIYDQVENLTTKTAQFAKAVDKITPDIFDYLTPPPITAARYKHFVGIERDEIVPLIEKHKHPYMLWNPFMTEFHELLLTEIDKKLEMI